MLRSSLLRRHGFEHGFSPRRGGVSPPPYDSLNLGAAVGDRPDLVATNRRRFCEALGVPPRLLFEVSQVHAATVREICDRDRERAGDLRGEEADALTTRAGGVAVGVRVADCLPLLIADPRSGMVAAVHVGWRGAVAGIVGRALDEMERMGASANDLLTAIGPHIRCDHFEVGEDVAAQIAAAAPQTRVIIQKGDARFADLAAVARAQLLGRGIRSEHVDDVGGDTFEDAERFFSYRRDGGCTGRHLAAIVCRAKPPPHGLVRENKG